MKNILKIYWRVALWGLGLLLLLFALSMALSYVRFDKLWDATGKNSLERELGIELPEYWESPMPYNDDAHRGYKLYLREPLSSESIRQVEEWCGDPRNAYWERDNRYDYYRKNILWGYDVQCRIHSSEKVSVIISDYSLTSFSVFLIPFYLFFGGLVVWVAVIPLWGLVLLVMALVRARKQSKAEAQ